MRGLPAIVFLDRLVKSAAGAGWWTFADFILDCWFLVSMGKKFYAGKNWVAKSRSLAKGSAE